MVDWRLYRSVMLPDPLWKEQALYGGYEWVQVVEGFWVNRRWEAELGVYLKLQEGRLKCRAECIQEFVRMLVDSGMFVDRVPIENGQLVSAAKFDDYLRVELVDKVDKVFSAVKYYSTLIVYGWNSEIQELCEKYGDRFDSVLCSVEVPTLGFAKIGVDSLRNAHLHQRVIVAKEEVSLKPQIINWSSIAVV